MVKFYFTIIIYLLFRPQIIDHKSIDENKSSDIDEITKPMSTLSPIKPPAEEKKKDKKEYV